MFSGNEVDHGHHGRMRRPAVLLGLLLLFLSACTSTTHRSTGASTGRPAAPSASTAPTRPGTGSTAAAAGAPAVPRFSHVVVVVEENHAAAEILGNPGAPYMNALARSGVVLTRSYGITHPSYPNYLALFSGSTHGISDDSCPHYFGGTNLGAQLRAHGLSFGGYAQGLPSTGYRGCTAGKFARRHAPWIDFTDLPRSLSRPMTAFPTDYSRLPRLAFVIPDLNHDMHDGTVAQADGWLRQHLARYVSWAGRHNSLLVVTWDEDDKSANNHVLGLLAGAHLRHGRYTARVDHYGLLRTLEAAFGLPAIGAARQRAPITGIWSP
jgi:acid phosphatase